MMDGDCEIGGGRCMVLTAVLKLRRNSAMVTGFPLFWNFWKPGNVREFS